MEEKIIEFAPYILVALIVIWQNNLFVKPEALEKLHREILDEIDKKIGGKYVEINAYKEFQNHIYSKLEQLTSTVDELKDFLMNER